jgi:transcriptional regulator with XRE-family HTH domain
MKNNEIEILPGASLPPTPTNLAEQKTLLSEYCRQAVVNVRLTKGPKSKTKFAEKYGICRAQYYRIESGRAMIPADKFLLIMITAGYTLDLETINRDYLGVKK